MLINFLNIIIVRASTILRKLLLKIEEKIEIFIINPPPPPQEFLLLLAFEGKFSTHFLVLHYLKSSAQTQKEF